jgi:hypothetical protein
MARLLREVESASQIKEAFALAATGHHDARQDAMYQRSPEGLVTSAHLAGDDRRPQHLLGVVVRGRYLGVVQEHQPLAALSPDVAIEAIQLRAYRPRQAVEPILDLLDAAGVAGGGQCLTPPGQVDGFLQERAQRLQIRPLTLRVYQRSPEGLVTSAAKTERVPVAGLRCHTLLAKLPAISPLELPSGEVATPGPAQPVVAHRGELVLAGRELLSAARSRGDEAVDVVVVDLPEDGQVELILMATAKLRRLTDDQLAVVAAHIVVEEAKRSRAERARRGGKAKAAKKAGCSGGTSSTEQDNGAARPRALERAVKLHGLKERMVRQAVELVRKTPALADEVLAGSKTLKGARSQLKQAPATRKAGPGGMDGKGRLAAAGRVGPPNKAGATAVRPARESDGPIPDGPAGVADADAGGAEEHKAEPDLAGEAASAQTPPAVAAAPAITTTTLFLPARLAPREVAAKLFDYYGMEVTTQIAEEIRRLLGGSIAAAPRSKGHGGATGKNGSPPPPDRPETAGEASAAAAEANAAAASAPPAFVERLARARACAVGEGHRSRRCNDRLLCPRCRGEAVEQLGRKIAAGQKASPGCQLLLAEAAVELSWPFRGEVPPGAAGRLGAALKAARDHLGGRAKAMAAAGGVVTARPAAARVKAAAGPRGGDLLVLRVDVAMLADPGRRLDARPFSDTTFALPAAQEEGAMRSMATARWRVLEAGADPAALAAGLLACPPPEALDAGAANAALYGLCGKLRLFDSIGGWRGAKDAPAASAGRPAAEELEQPSETT